MKPALSRLLPVGMRWRLTAWVAAVLALCFAVVFVAVYRGTGHQLRQQIDHTLASEMTSFTRHMSLLQRHAPGEVAHAAAAYVRAQPFSAGSTLQFALVPGAAIATNQPEFFGVERPDHGESAAEQEHENHLAGRLLSIHDGYSTLELPDVGGLRLLKRQIRVGSSPVALGVGQPLEPVARAQDGVARAFVLAGALMGLVALLASYLVGSRVSRPLRQMAVIATRVDAGDLHPRIHDVGSRRDEVRVLADSFNHMLDRLTEAFAGQRAFVADASHELRTPLTVIKGQLEVLAAAPNPSVAEVRRVEELVQAEVGRVSRLIDDLLLLARSEQTSLERPQAIDVPAFVKELWDATTSTAERRFELDAISAGRLRVDPDRLAQALRNLLGNAIAHTAPGSGRIRLTVRPRGERELCFAVEDDGPGIPEDQRELVFERFHRTDAARTREAGGTGLGLAIVRAIAIAHGGAVSAGSSVLGGARVELCLPGFDAAAERGLGGQRPHEALDPQRADGEADQGRGDDRGRGAGREHVL
jgi:two-component system, OmpR family, sensor kinase